MPLWNQIKNVFRRDRLNAELDEEFQSHLKEAIASGRDETEARRAFGNFMSTREISRNLKLAVWLDHLTSDFTFAARQLVKNKIATAAAIVSLGLAIGACAASFLLIDALLFRPLSVANVDRLFVVTMSYTDPEGKADYNDSFNYPLFREVRQALQADAELIAVSYTIREDITFGSDAEMERAHRQHVSGWTFGVFGLKPALGRLLTENDDRKPGAHPVAVLSYDYWRNRFGLDPKVLGRTVRLGKTVYEIVGVGPKGFTGTETGTPADFFTPMMMEPERINDPGHNWFRAWVALKSGASPELVRQKTEATIRAHRVERVKNWPASAPKSRIEDFVNTKIELQSAAAGYSWAQKQYRTALGILAVLVGLGGVIDRLFDPLADRGQAELLQLQSEWIRIRRHRCRCERRHGKVSFRGQVKVHRKPGRVFREIEQPEVLDFLAHVGQRVAAEDAVCQAQQPEGPLLAVVHVEFAGTGVARNHHEQQQPLRVFDPMSHHGFGRAQEVPDDLGHIPFWPYFQVLRAEHLARAYGNVCSHLSSPFWGLGSASAREAAIYIRTGGFFACFDWFRLLRLVLG